MANSSFFKNDGVTTSLNANLTGKAADAEKLAINPEDEQFTLSDGTTTGYSALHHKEKALDAQTAAETAQTAAETAKTGAETAKTGAETAKTAAETAKTGAETAKTAAETAETNAETAETNASTSATNAATSETNAATSATTASTKASEASTSASNAATSATSAETAKTAAETAKTAAETAKTAAETAKTAAETAETNAETAESNASTSETNAANSATSASTSATTATTKASEASTSATNAATSATTASTKASEASTSAAAAAASQTAAAASAASAASTYDQFDDRYLGTKSSDPTVDNDGNALVEGALYFSSTDNAMQVYDGSAWIAASSAGNVSITETHFTTTAGQTTFNISYTVDNLVVIMNGVVLQNGASKDYTATNGTSFTLASGAAAGDELHVIVFKSFTTADMVSKTNGGAYSGSVDFTGGLEINGTAVTATAAELNTLDGVTATTAELNTLDGVTATASEINALDGITASTAELNLLDGVIATTAEINYLDGVTSNIQTQIDNASTSLSDLGITATSTELNYVDGVTSNIQTQIDNISTDVVSDTTPQLGGNLDAQGNDITNVDKIGAGDTAPVSYANSASVITVKDDTNPAFCLNDTGQTRDWWIVANGSNLNFNYADGGGSGSVTNNTNALSLRNSGRVGINEDTPDGQLHITGTNASDGATLYMQEANNNTSDTLGSIFFGNNVDSSLARIIAYTDTNNTTSHLRFMPTNSGTARKALDLKATEAVFNDNGEDYDFRVESDTNTHALFVQGSDGKIGINEAIPETLLHITDNTANDGPVIQLEGSGQNASDNLLGAINWKNNDTSGDGPTIVGGIRVKSSSGTGAGGYMGFYTHDGTEGGEGSDAVERFRVQASGDILAKAEGGGSGMNIDLRQGAAKQWHTVDMTSSFVTDDSYNVTSLVDAAAGRVTTNINNDMDNTGYAPSGFNKDGSGFNDWGLIYADVASTKTTGVLQYSVVLNGSENDSDGGVSMIIHGDLA